MLFRTFVSLGFVWAAACGAPPPHPAESAGRPFHPVGELYFLPERETIELREAALVPDSKIAWEARMIAANIGLARQIEIAVSEQVVTLGGKVPDGDAHATLVSAVKRIHGVAAVRDELEVTGE